MDRVGDPRHRWGFRYDERDGTGPDLRPALVPHRGRSVARWHLLRTSTARRCLSAPADPNGAGDDARVGLRTALGTPLRKAVARLERRVDRVEARTERFDAWESCVRWLPVTEAGDAEQDLGFLVRDSSGARHLPAVDLDHSEWDDPDYQVLAFRGRDRPFRDGECGGDPGESADRRALRVRSDGIRGRITALREDVEDLVDPVDDIARFDQCAYTVGLVSRPGYRFRPRSGPEVRRTAISFDMRGARLPAVSVLAFPGEEPPQIECNEDAGGIETHG